MEVKAPSCVDYTVYEGEKCLKVHLLNSQTLYPPLPIETVQISIALKGQKVCAVRDLTGGSLKWELCGDAIILQTDLNVYKMIMVELE